jgi:hypothetical protein
MNDPVDDEVIELTSLPPPDPGAPIPLLFADEHRLVVAYYANARAEPWVTEFGKAPIVALSEDNVAAVRFSRCYSHTFGPPNDEAFSGHRLYNMGLRPYSFCEVLRSSWIRALERMNAVHPHHDPRVFDRYRHFVIAFHDSTLECVAVECRFEAFRGDPNSALLGSIRTDDI